MELIEDQFYVLDGYDARPPGDPLEVRGVRLQRDGAEPATPPTASFTASTTSGDAPLTVNFTDTSPAIRRPRASWTSVERERLDTSTSPTHTYTTPGTYTVTLTATNSRRFRQRDGARSSSSSRRRPRRTSSGTPGSTSNTAGWGTAASGTGVTLTRVTPGRDGTGGAAPADQRCHRHSEVRPERPAELGDDHHGGHLHGEHLGARTTSRASDQFKLMLKDERRPS